MVSITEFQNVFFEDMDPEYQKHYPIKDLVGKPFVIVGVETYSNDKGDGVAVAIELNGHPGHFCTHATGIVKLLSRQDIIDTCRDGDVIECKIIERDSKNGNGRRVYVLTGA